MLEPEAARDRELFDFAELARELERSLGAEIRETRGFADFASQSLAHLSRA